LKILFLFYFKILIAYVALTSDDSNINKPRKEGCSCLYGNPCMDPYVCEDWTNRFEVAKRNGYKGGW